jgi:hypothetical protein
MPENARYAGRPLVRLLDAYVLAAIGELDDRSSEQLYKMTPRLQATFKCSGAWDEIVASVMHFPSNMPELIRQSWVKNSALAAANGETLLPVDFMLMFVDANFLPCGESGTE